MRERMSCSITVNVWNGKLPFEKPQPSLWRIVEIRENKYTAFFFFFFFFFSQIHINYSIFISRRQTQKSIELNSFVRYK